MIYPELTLLEGDNAILGLWFLSAVDPKDKNLLIQNHGFNKSTMSKLYQFRITDIETIVIDEAQVAAANNGVVGAAIGAAVAGPTGAALGAMSSGSSIQRICKIRLTDGTNLTFRGKEQTIFNIKSLVNELGSTNQSNIKYVNQETIDQGTGCRYTCLVVLIASLTGSLMLALVIAGIEYLYNLIFH